MHCYIVEKYVFIPWKHAVARGVTLTFGGHCNHCWTSEGHTNKHIMSSMLLWKWCLSLRWNSTVLKNACSQIRTSWYKKHDFCDKTWFNLSMPRIEKHDVCDVTLSVHPHQASWKVSLATVGIKAFSLPGVDAHSE